MKVCPLQIIECDFCYAGCKTKLPRKDMLIHQTENSTHMLLMVAFGQNLAKQNEMISHKLYELQKENQKLKLELNEKTQRLEQHIEQRATQVREQSRRELEMRTSQFKTEIGLEVTRKLRPELNEKTQRLEQHIEQRATQVIERELEMRTSQFKTEIGLEMARLQREQEELAPMREATLMHEIAKLKRNQHDSDQTFKKELTVLEENQAKKNKTMKQEVRKLKEKQSHICYIHRICVVPIRLCVENFSKLKLKNDSWDSCPFYTHPRGYKMQLQVLPNGSGEGKGTHISVFVYLVRGEFDDELEWPFVGEITIDLHNQLEDKNHFTRTVHYTDEQDNGRRVTAAETSSGWGWQLFIPHGQLGYNRAKNCQYLKHNQLEFDI